MKKLITLELKINNKINNILKLINDVLNVNLVLSF